MTNNFKSLYPEVRKWAWNSLESQKVVSDKHTLFTIILLNEQTSTNLGKKNC